MAHFTKQEIEEIRQRLSETAVKDSQFPDAGMLSLSDFVAIVQSGKNKKIPILDLCPEIAPYVYDYVVTVTPFVKNGSTMLKKGGEADLAASVILGYEDVTDRIAPSSFSWKRSSGSENADRLWNLAHDGVGPEIHVTSNDVNSACTFYVQIPISSIINN